MTRTVDTVRFTPDSATLVNIVVSFMTTDAVPLDSLRRVTEAMGATLGVDTSYEKDQTTWFHVHAARATTIPRSTIVRVEQRTSTDEDRYELLLWRTIFVVGIAVQVALTKLHLQ